MECSCSINGCGDDTYEDDEQKNLVFEPGHIILNCGECGREIKKGEKYEWYRGKYDGVAYTHHTCLDCVSLRDHFFYDWTFERLWDDFYYHMENCGWQVPEECLSNCTPAMREKICKYIERSWEESHPTS